VRAVRSRWPGVSIEIRADSGCAVPALYRFCEREQIVSTIGLIPNRRLEQVAAPLLGPAKDQRAATGEKVRLVAETTYQAGSWDRARRVVYKAKALDQGPNTRFVVTTRTDEPAALYEFSVDRGEMEGWIKDYKRACIADRLSDHRFWANQFRLFLHAAAYWLLDTLRRWLQTRGHPALQLDTLRLRLTIRVPPATVPCRGASFPAVLRRAGAPQARPTAHREPRTRLTTAPSPPAARGSPATTPCKRPRATLLPRLARFLECSCIIQASPSAPGRPGRTRRLRPQLWRAPFLRPRSPARPDPGM
jgi:hypothetical protein